MVERLRYSLEEGSEILGRVIHQAQERFRGNHVKGKIYSLHEPEVVCIRKGKRGKPNEYGSKVLISTDRNGYVVAHREYMSNPADSELLEDAVSDWHMVCGVVPGEVGADRGFYRSCYTGEEKMREVNRWAIPSKGKKPHPEAETYWFKRIQRKRTGLEAVIGHLKTDHGMDRCRYKGFEGDVINGCLVVIAWNLKKWSKVLCPG